MLALHMPGVGKDGNALLVPKIKENGWQGGIISVPYPFNPDPTSPEFKDRVAEAKREVKAVLAATGYGAIRLSAFIPVDAPGWARLARNPRSTYGPYNPDQGMWDAQVGYLKALFAALKEACAELGIPVGRVFVEYANERGIGGVNAALVDVWSKVRSNFTLYQGAWAAGDSIKAKEYWLRMFLPWTWNDGPMPEGWVPEQTWQYLRYLRSKAGLGGLRGIGYTSEASTGDVGETELESMVASPSALIYLDLFEFPLAVNHYSKSAKDQWVKAEKRYRNLSPIESAVEWWARLRTKCDRARLILGPYLTRPEKLNRIPVMESGFWAAHAPTAAQIPLYRRAYVDRMQLVAEDHPFIGYYTGLSTDATNSGVHLYQLKDSKLVVVGGEVGPKLDYDGSLESAA